MNTKLTELVMNEFDDGDELFESRNGAQAPISLKVTESACGVRLDKVLSQLIPQYSRGRIQQWIEAGHVTVDGATAKVRMTLLGDEAILVHPQAAPEENAFQPEPVPLDVIYEDAAVIVINKPAGLVVHPAAGNWSGTLLNGLLYRFPELASVPRAGIVHRLDKDTSGLMVVARTMIAQTDLVRQMQARSVKRQYLALVWGLTQEEGTIDAPIARHVRDRMKMSVTRSITAKPAITHFSLVAEGTLENKLVSLVECRLETGRTHQIRVHMQSIGFPLVGDQVYGKPNLNGIFPRQALQAWRLGIVHPTTGRNMQWSVPLAEDFSALLERSNIDPADLPRK